MVLLTEAKSMPAISFGLQPCSMLVEAALSSLLFQSRKAATTNSISCALPTPFMVTTTAW